MTVLNRALPEVNPSIQVIVKSNLRSFRKKNGETQDELARAIGVTRQTILKIEKNGQVPVFILAALLANHYNATIEEIFECSFN
ncbi:helix-turn-helix transcriptional regulator [Paenibacillus taichungensis]|uniref:helix-turn-helix transcriptional regulator n=1 Tax=Paenibacillus taichungensis TaxID=484184 RepID=UPI001FEC8A24|nr:helix-turn-helix transcriptional regulator [Paenibacillus taichungensis]